MAISQRHFVATGTTGRSFAHAVRSVQQVSRALSSKVLLAMDAFLRRAPGQSLPPAVATRKSSDVWDHAKVHSKDGSNHKIDCVYCGRKDWVVTATRFQQHLGHIKGKGATCPRTSRLSQERPRGAPSAQKGGVKNTFFAFGENV